MTKTLTPTQFVTVAGWDRAFQFNTLTRYAIDKGYDIVQEHARAEKFGHPVAWTINPGTCLLGDREAARRALAQEAAEFAGATVLTDGEQVLIEGAPFTVKVMGPRYADPIHFEKVTDSVPSSKYVASAYSYDRD